MDREAYLLHQVHLAKLATDVAADVVSTALIWQGRVTLGLLAAFVPAGAASALVVRRDLSPLRGTARGRYVLEHMPPAAQGVRLAGQVLAWRAAARHDARGVLLGHLVVAVGWSHGLLRRDSPRDRGQSRTYRTSA